MSFWTSLSGDQLRASVKIRFYGDENAASVEMSPEPVDATTTMLQYVLFLSYYVRTACDLQVSRFEVLKNSMDIMGKNIKAFELGLSPLTHLSELNSLFRLQPVSSSGVTRMHSAELYQKRSDVIFPQTKWNPYQIDKYGPISTLFYYQSLIDHLPEKEDVGFLASRVELVHKYFQMTGGKPNITQVLEAVKFAMEA